MRRPLIPLMIAATLALTPTAAQAEESLLSGYGGPGGGEQIVLGGKLLPPKSGNGGLRAARSSRSTAAPLTSVPAGAALAGGTTGAQAGGSSQASGAGSAAAPAGAAAGKRASGGASGSGPASRGEDRAQVSEPGARVSLPPLPSRAVQASRVGGDNGFPLTARDLGLLALAALILPLTALAMRRLAAQENLDALG